MRRCERMWALLFLFLFRSLFLSLSCPFPSLLLFLSFRFSFPFPLPFNSVPFPFPFSFPFFVSIDPTRQQTLRLPAKMHAPIAHSSACHEKLLVPESLLLILQPLLLVKGALP